MCIFDERMGIEKAMDGITRRITMLHQQYANLLDRLRELDNLESFRKVNINEIDFGESEIKESKIEQIKEPAMENNEVEEVVAIPKRTYSDVLPEVVRILKEAPVPVRASILREKLEESCGVTQKNFTSFMNELMKKDDRIIRPNRGFYEYLSN